MTNLHGVPYQPLAGDKRPFSQPLAGEKRTPGPRKHPPIVATFIEGVSVASTHHDAKEGSGPVDAHRVRRLA